jgi:hypothetical protein
MLTSAAGDASDPAGQAQAGLQLAGALHTSRLPCAPLAFNITLRVQSTALAGRCSQQILTKTQRRLHGRSVTIHQKDTLGSGHHTRCCEPAEEVKVCGLAAASKKYRTGRKE